MNDLISRSALIAEYDRVHVGAPGGARKLMVDAPAVDAVPVVRCEDCKHHAMHHGVLFCGFDHIGLVGDVHPDDFCPYGERRSGE